MSGDNGEYNWIVVALCDGECESIEALWLDGDEIPKADIDWTPSATGSGGTGTGDVSTSAWIGSNSTEAVRAFWTLGDADQVDVALLTDTFSDLGSSFRGRGVVLGGVSLRYDADTEEIWREKGQPRDVKWVVKGRKVYDRRKDALNADPDFETFGQAIGAGIRWYRDEAQTLALLSSFSESGGVLTVSDDDDGSENLFSERIPVDTSKVYTVSVDARQTAGDRQNYLLVAFYDSNGDNINGNTESDATGWTNKGTYHYFDISNAVIAGTWTTYSIDFGSGGTASIPTGAVTMSIGGLFSGNGAVGTATTIDIRDFHVREGTGTRHDFSDSSTWEWSDNNSMCLADFATQIANKGTSIPYASIDWEAAIAAAQACDVSAAIPTASSESRFTSNGVLSLGDTDKENIDKMLSSMGGRIYWTQGKWRWTASTWEAPAITIDADWLTEEPVTLQGFEEPAQRFNTVRGFYTDPDRNYEPVEFQPVTDASYGDTRRGNDRARASTRNDEHRNDVRTACHSNARAGQSTKDRQFES